DELAMECKRRGRHQVARRDPRGAPREDIAFAAALVLVHFRDGESCFELLIGRDVACVVETGVAARAAGSNAVIAVWKSIRRIGGSGGKIGKIRSEAHCVLTDPSERPYADPARCASWSALGAIERKAGRALGGSSSWRRRERLADDRLLFSVDHYAS